MTEAAVKNFFRILGEEQVEPDKLPEKLAEIAEHHLTLLKQVEALRPNDPNVAALRQKALDAIDRGDYPSAENFLKEAEERDLAAFKQLQETANQRLRSAAASRASRGELSLTQLDYRAAAEHFKAARDYLPPGDDERRADYTFRYAGALYRQGNEKGDNAALKLAIEAYREALEERTRERVPLQWATTQTNLGNALFRLGERESGTETLQAAVAAYREP